jgi:hypothetical protein
MKSVIQARRKQITKKGDIRAKKPEIEKENQKIGALGFV